MANKITPQLINPESIAIVGASNNIHKPGGKLLKNILSGNFNGKLFVVNPKEESVQGIKSYNAVNELPQVDLAILAIPAKLCPDTVKILTEEKNTKAFIIISAGFSEENEEGRLLEEQIVEYVDKAGACLIGPNCIGVMTPAYQGVFTLPIPKLSPDGVDFISGSGATAVFVMESGMPKGLQFSSVYSVGNSSQIGVEEMLEYFDETYDPGVSSKNKILYIESIDNPQKLYKHASSLIKKGCRIAAIKAGSSEAGSRAASSHTGAIASSDIAVDALFRKAGIIRCYGREELSYMAGIFNHPSLNGRNVAIITHAGGPAVMLTDKLSEGGFSVPHLEGKDADELLSLLYPGSSSANPIDILATGTAEQVDKCIDYCENRFHEIDAIVIIFGSSGLSEVYDVYDVIHKRMKSGEKPIYPVLPSISTAGAEVKYFLDKGHVNFADEVILGECLNKMVNTMEPAGFERIENKISRSSIEKIIKDSGAGYLEEDQVFALLDLAGIPRVKSWLSAEENELLQHSEQCGFPLVMKVVGPLHKSDVGGVSLNIKDKTTLISEFKRMIKIAGCQAVMIQPMVSGNELFIGASYEGDFGHMILCGLGGIYIEMIKDFASGLVPLDTDESLRMIRSLKSYPLFKGYRGKEPINEMKFATIITRLSELLTVCPEIVELDLNPLIAEGENIIAVDARIKIIRN